jgi:hypothetical protein
MGKKGRNGKEEYDESSEANLINRRVKIAIQPPREGDQTNDRTATWVTEVRRVKKARRGRERDWAIWRGNTHMFAKLIVVGVLDLVEVILVQLPDERGKVGVFEHPGQDRFCEFVHVLDDKTVASGTPRNDMLEVGIFEHPKIIVARSVCAFKPGERQVKAYL